MSEKDVKSEEDVDLKDLEGELDIVF